MRPAAIIDTKLMPAFVAPDLLQRRHLLEQLLDARHSRFILVNSEAGAGKTSLLATFAKHFPSPISWYSLQEVDREVVVFLTYLCEALQRTFPGIGSRALEQVRAGGGMDWRSVTTSLVNDMVRHGNPIVLVIDDFHLVGDVAGVVAIVDFLLRNAPPNFQLILATRQTPDLPLAWLRGKAMMLELGSTDLRFTTEEIRQVFQFAWQLPIDEDVARLLLERTEGWVTGLQLVSQAVRARSAMDVRSYVLGLGGKEQFIYDYLAQEVYLLQPREVQDFLKRTSLPERFNLELARTLVDGDPTDRLKHLESGHLFLVRLDSQNEWFRYHHLFRDFLRHRVEIEDGTDHVRHLHGRSASWLEASGNVATAIPHYLLAEQLDDVVRLLETRGAVMMAEGLHQSLSDWMDRIPPSVRDHRPSLKLLQAQLCELRGDWPAAIFNYEETLQLYRMAGDDQQTSQVLEALLMCHFQFGSAEAVVRFCQSALQAAPPEDLASRATLQCHYGVSLMYCGRDWKLAYQLIADGYRLAYHSGNPRAIAWACVANGFGPMFARGNFAMAEQVLNEGIELLRNQGWFPMLYQILMNKCVVQIFAGGLDRASDLIEDTITLANRGGQAFVLVGLEMSRAMLCLEQRDFHRCSQAFSRLVETSVPAHIKPWYFRTLMLLHTGRQNIEQAATAATEMQRVLDLNGYGWYAPECLISLAWMHEQGGQRLQAIESLNRALAIAREGECRFWEMKALIVRAYMFSRERSRQEKARNDLSTALTLSKEHEYAQFWRVDPLGLTVPVLVFALASDLETEYARKLLVDYGDDRLVPALNELIQRGNHRERGAAYELMSGLGTQEARDVIRQAHRDHSNQVRATARRTVRSTAHIEISSLGQFQVLNNGEPVKFYGRLSHRLLSYLISHYNSPIPLEEVIDYFWPSKDGERAQHNLNVQLNLIRLAMMPDIRSRSFFVSLRVRALVVQLDDHIRLDLAEFDRLFQEGLQARRESQEEVAVTRFLRAEALCNGTLLPATGDEPWIFGPRQRVAEAYRTIVGYLADRECTAGQWAEAAAWYRKQVQRAPADETTVRSLLRCHIMMRDLASARREYDSLRRHLKSQFHSEPTLQTQLMLEHPDTIA